MKKSSRVLNTILLICSIGCIIIGILGLIKVAPIPSWLGGLAFIAAGMNGMSLFLNERR